MHLKSLVGADISTVSNIEEDYEWATSLGYGFILADLYKKGKRTLNGLSDSRTNKETGLNFLSIKSSKCSNGVVGKISTWIDLDNECEAVRISSEKALLEELEWAAFLSIPAVVIKIVRKENSNLARVLSSFVAKEHVYFRIWLSIPLEEEESELDVIDDGTAKSNTWSWWQQLSMQMAEFVSNFMVMLRLPMKLTDEKVIKHWYSEPIAAIETPTKTYLTNRSGYPVLSIEAQNLILKFFKLRIQVIISGEVNNSRGYLSYYQYIAHLWKNREQPSIYEKNSKEMEDHLQDPLQPLADHLPSVTYSIFELDPYKYVAYEKAIYLALCDTLEHGAGNDSSSVEEDKAVSDTSEMNDNEETKVDSGAESIELDEMSNQRSSDELDSVANGVDDSEELMEDVPSLENGHSATDEAVLENGDSKKTYASVVGGGNVLHKPRNRAKLVVMVLGAGRGPLVDCTLRAAALANCAVTVYVVEKNPSAVVYLRNRLQSDWANLNIVLYPGDMRDVQLPRLAHIFVSELLGSFGDNELSPECLDGAQRFLRPGGISIPTSYTSYIAPMQSTKLYHDMSCQQPNRTCKQSKNASLETPYVVNLKNFCLLTDVEPVFTFVHPKKELNETNNRYKKISFKVPMASVVHGFAGYFHSVLYKDVAMSIHPEWHSPDMFSWFPIAFPLSSPLQLSAGTEIDLHMWRLSDSKAVWYEWGITGQSQHTTSIHNPGGRSYSMSLLSK